LLLGGVVDELKLLTHLQLIHDTSQQNLGEYYQILQLESSALDDG
jgi:hypothetical protein